MFIPSARGQNMEATTRVISSKGERIRDDARVPVLVLQSETDVILLGGGLAEQPDSDRVRVWEMAGAAHADTYTVSAGRHDDGTLSAERMAELLRPTTNLMIGQDGHADQRRAPAALRRPGRAGAPGAVGGRRGGPAAAPRLDLDAEQDGLPPRRPRQCAGGIRTPWVEVPTAVLSGLGQSGETFAMLFGRTEPFDEATLAALYPGGKTSTSSGSRRPSTPPSRPVSSSSEDRAEILAVAAASLPAAGWRHRLRRSSTTRVADVNCRRTATHLLC